MLRGWVAEYAVSRVRPAGRRSSSGPGARVAV